MPHPDITNTSPYACELLFVNDSGGFLVCVPLIQATLRIRTDGPLELLAKQPPVDLAGQWWGDPAGSSMRIEPQIAPEKPGTDIVLLGHAYPGNRERTEGLIGIKVGALQKVARVFGDRRLIRRFGFDSITAPEPFERIPLTYEHAFGGWDRRHPDPSQHSFEPRNPVGMGYRDSRLPVEPERVLPNIEDPAHPLRSASDRPPPVGFGFIAPDWPTRARYAGTYDKQWSDNRKPLLPVDFDPRFFNAASPGLVAPEGLVGNESISVIGASENGRVDFALPAIPPPALRIVTSSGQLVDQMSKLDTVIVDMDQLTVTLLWRSHLVLRRGIHEISELQLPPMPAVPPDDDDAPDEVEEDGDLDWDD